MEVCCSMQPITALAKRMLKLSISFSFFVVRSVGRWAVRVCGKAPEPECTVLYYHAIPPYQRHLFARQMDYVCRLTTAILLDGRTRLPDGGRYCCITFDDGFQSVIENALPELVKRRLPAIFFVTVDALGKRADWWPGTACYEVRDPIVTAEQLRRLPAEGLTIGSHTLSHPRLTSLKDSDAIREIVLSRSTLQKLLGRSVCLFSVPFGEFDDRIIRICRDAGYERVFISRPTNTVGNHPQFVTGRIAIQPTDWSIEFRLKLLGAYSWLPYVSSLKQRISTHHSVSGLLTMFSFGSHHS